MEWSALKERLIEAAAAAALLGGGAQLVGNTVDLAKQDARIEAAEADDRLILQQLGDIQDEVSETREAVARLEAKMEE